MLIIDINEPLEIIDLVKQSVQVTTNQLNNLNMSDYYFAGCDGRTYQYSRKQAGELLSDIDEAEKQLRDYYLNADQNNQVVEGIISPVSLVHKKKKMEWGAFDFKDGISSRAKPMTDVLFSYKVAPNGHLYDEHPHRVKPALLDNWLFQLSQCGITYFTLNYIYTAQMLVHHYQSVQEPVHGTMQRVIRPKIILKSHDPFIKAVMSLSIAYDIGIGETKAEALKAAGFHTLLDLGMAEVDELCAATGIGKTLASKLLTAIGRSLDGDRL